MYSIQRARFQCDVVCVCLFFKRALDRCISFVRALGRCILFKEPDSNVMLCVCVSFLKEPWIDVFLLKVA